MKYFSSNGDVFWKSALLILKLHLLVLRPIDIQAEAKDFPKKTLTRSDEKSCTKNLANRDLANTDFETLTRSAKKKKQHYLANRGPY